VVGGLTDGYSLCLGYQVSKEKIIKAKADLKDGATGAETLACQWIGDFLERAGVVREKDMPEACAKLRELLREELIGEDASSDVDKANFGNLVDDYLHGSTGEEFGKPWIPNHSSV